MREDGTPISRLEHISVCTSIGPRYSGSLTIRDRSFIPNDGTYHVFIKALDRKGHLMQILFAGVKLSHNNDNIFDIIDIRQSCPVGNAEDPWDKIKRMIKADKEFYMFPVPYEKNTFIGPSEYVPVGHIAGEVIRKEGPPETVKINNTNDFNTPENRRDEYKWNQY